MSENNAIEIDPDFAPDERIFHYTSAQGLYGILNSKSIWATHFQFLNDSKEFYAARDSLTEFVRKEIHKQLAAFKVNQQFEFHKEADLSGLAEHEAKVIVGSLYDTTYEHLGVPYVFSGFCCKPDHRSYTNGGLLHWATYGRQGGYAIRFNPHKIQLLLREENKRYLDSVYRSGKVTYIGDTLEDRFKKDYEIIASVARSMVVGLIKNDMSEVDLFKSADPFWRVSSMLKDAYFRDESEARVVFMRMNFGKDGSLRHAVEMRHGGGVSIPYICLFKDILFGENCPIESILIGPHPEKARRLRALSTYLRSVKLDFIEILESDVPYIN